MNIYALLPRLFAIAHYLAVTTYASDVILFPSNGAKDVNIDTHLVLSFQSSPEIGSSGNVTVKDVESGKVMDTLDLSIPSSPSPYGNGSTKADYTDKTTYQTNIVGGMDFYFFPIIIRENVATIYLHNNRLEYNRTYSVTIDTGVLQFDDNAFDGIASGSWTFSTKTEGPARNASEVTVSADGSADFNTLQGALDWAPSNSPTHTTIHIRDGNYEELVYFQYKSNIIIRGESRNKTLIGYPNNSAFNPPNRQGPSRRPAFSSKASQTYN